MKRIDNTRLATLKLGRHALVRLLGEVDWVLLFLVSLIVICGLLNLYSATLGTSHQVKFRNQLVWCGLGYTVLGCVTFFDYRNFFRVAWLFIVAVVMMMIAVKVFSDPIKGSNRWLILGGVRLQPSELTKIALIIASARLLHQAKEFGGRLLDYVPACLMLVVPILLVLLQPDLGSATLCGLVIVSMAVTVAKKTWPYYVSGFLGVCSLPLFWHAMHEYQKGRVRAFLRLVDDSSGATWQTDQSLNAVGSGQIWGKGYQKATQNQFEFLPEHWTDFPFSVWAEEWGFVGSVALIGLVFLLIIWILLIGLKVRDRFGQALCVGVSAMIFWHMLVNVMMVTGMAPVVGVTLPLISYGGSSMVTFFIALGLVSSVSLRNRS